MRRAFSLIAIVGLILTACQTTQPSTGSESTGPTRLVMRVEADWSYDVFAPPQYTLGGFEFGYATYDSLLAYEPGTWKLIPYVATSWSVTPNSVTFKVRDDVTCTDGTKLTATTIADFFKWKVADPGRIGIQPGVAGLGPYTITANEAEKSFTFQTTVPKATLVNSLGTTWLPCPAGIAPGVTDRATKSYGTGPYTIVSYVVGDNIVFKKRPDWKWGPQGASAKDLPDELVFRVVANNTTAANLVTTGQIDLTVMSGSDLARLEQDSNITVHTWPVFSVSNLGFNQFPGSLFSDINLRKAVIAAVDPRAWDKASNDGRGVVSTAPVAKNHPCYNPATEQMAPTPSLANAKAILQQAGYSLGSDGKLQKDGRSLPVVKILGSTQHNAGPDYIGATLDQLGFKTDVAKLPLSDYTTRYIKYDFDVMPSPIGGGANPGVLLPGLNKPSKDGGPPNSPNTINDPEAYKIFQDADSGGLLGGDALCKAWFRYQELIWKNAWFLPLSAVPSFDVSRKEKGLSFMVGYNGFGLIAIYSLKMKK